VSAPAGGRAVVLVDHGSRRREANAVAEALAEQLRARLGGARVVVAHLEIEEPDPASAVRRCVADGAREIVLLPLFLAPGRHGAGDLERIAGQAAASHPDVEVRCAEPIGAHPALVEALLDRLSGNGGPRRSG
jgi:sirohydrochlorin ferrochelatase